MKSRYPLLLTALVTGSVFADVPRSPSPSRYKDLYLNSAFTDDPPPPKEVEIQNDLPDWVLVGLSKYTDGVKVKLMNKKDRSRVTIPSVEATKMGFAIKEVKQDRNFIDGAVVTVQKGGMTGEVRFDPKFLVLKQAIGGQPVTAQKGGNQRGGKTPPRPGGNSKTPSRKGPPTPGQVPKPQVPTPTKATPNNAANNAATSGAKASGTNSSTRRKRYVPRTK